jgi:NADPH:quinone reductase-like Zn-dependent oxidoreductase
MTTTKAILMTAEKMGVITDVPVPNIRDDWILVENKAVAINPTDWKHIDMGLANTGAKLGVEYAGIVKEVGSKVTEFKQGDRVVGFCHGG